MRLENIFKRLTGAAVFALDVGEHGSLIRLAEGSGFRVFQVDAKQAESKETLLRAFATTLYFPDYFGNNWDALEECLRDLSWLPHSNFLLVFQNADSLLRLGHKEFAILVAILGLATFSWKAEGVVFTVVLLGGQDLKAAVESALESC